MYRVWVRFGHGHPMWGRTFRWSYYYGNIAEEVRLDAISKGHAAGVEFIPS